VVLVAFMLVVFCTQSLPLRSHREFDGSFEITRKLAGAAGGKQGVFLIGRGPGLGPMAFSVPLWLQEGQITVLLRVQPDTGYVRSFQRGFPGQPVFLLTPGPNRPVGYDALDLRRVEHVTASMPMWDESDERRPDKAHQVPIDLSVWLVQGG